MVLAGGLGRRIGGDKAVVGLGRAAADRVSARGVAAGGAPRCGGGRQAGHAAAEPAGRDGLDRAAGAPPPAGGDRRGAGAGRRAPGAGVRRRSAVVSAALVRALADADAQGTPAVVAAAGEDLQPLLARYEPSALEPLRGLANAAKVPLRAAIGSLGPVRFEVSAETLFNVNSPEDLHPGGRAARRAGEQGAEPPSGRAEGVRQRSSRT